MGNGCFKSSSRHSLSETSSSSSEVNSSSDEGSVNSHSARRRSLIALGVNTDTWAEGSSSYQDGIHDTPHQKNIWDASRHKDIINIINDCNSIEKEIGEDRLEYKKNLESEKRNINDRIIMLRIQENKFRQLLKDIKPFTNIYEFNNEKAKKWQDRLDEYLRINKHYQRLSQVAKDLNINPPSQLESSGWNDFSSHVFEHIVEEKKLNTDNDQRFLGDILCGGMNDVCKEYDRNSSRYRELMVEVLKKYDMFFKQYQEFKEFTRNKGTEASKFGEFINAYYRAKERKKQDS